jgi:putative ATP-dependent endonuclease of OLD family
MALLDAYGIPHGVMLDDDNSKDHHGAVNDLVEESSNSRTLAKPVKFPGCLEMFLGIPTPDRDDKKPVEIMKAVTDGKIAQSNLHDLRTKFCTALAIT